MATSTTSSPRVTRRSEASTHDHRVEASRLYGSRSVHGMLTPRCELKHTEVRHVTTAHQESGAGGGPTVLRMLLGAHLRRLREARGVSREDAGWEIRSSESKISR